MINNRNKNRNRSIERLLFRSIPVYEIDHLRSDLDIDQLIVLLEERIDRSLFNNIEAIFVVDSKKMEQRKVSSVYVDGSIYISNNDEDPNVSIEQIVKDVLHEVAHSWEETHSSTIYGDNLVANEFLQKRKKIHELLEMDFNLTFPEEEVFDLEFNPSLDRFYYSTVGYDHLAMIINGVFTSPYSITSLREYFANGFEEFFLGDNFYLKKICPQLHKKIQMLKKEIEM